MNNQLSYYIPNFMISFNSNLVSQYIVISLCFVSCLYSGKDFDILLLVDHLVSHIILCSQILLIFNFHFFYQQDLLIYYHFVKLTMHMDLYSIMEGSHINHHHIFFYLKMGKDLLLQLLDLYFLVTLL
jgi:hypothetical protein